MNVMTKRNKHALARLQLALHASIMLNSGVNSCQEKVHIGDACGQWSEYVEYDTKVQSLDGAAVVSDDARSVCIANEMCTSHTSAFEGNMYIDVACMECATMFE